ncbi:MAG: hypothetical protein ACK5UM_17565 [Pseudomonadota bacterium]|jgi:hypothetical protein|nr:hypothetical protein [Rubrivivax sp.]
MTKYEIEAMTLDELFEREASRQTSLAAMAVLLQTTLNELLHLAEHAKLDVNVPEERVIRESAFNWYFEADAQLEAIAKPLGQAFRRAVEAGLEKRTQAKS